MSEIYEYMRVLTRGEGGKREGRNIDVKDMYIYESIKHIYKKNICIYVRVRTNI